MPVERLQRSLARAGFGSRRVCEELIAAGRVEINGRVATLGDRLDPAMDHVRVDGSKVNVNPELRTFALHKPRGVTTTMRDPHAERDLSGFLPKGVHLFPVGRLDRDTEGLLLLTNDGGLANRLTHPRYEVPKTYVARLKKPIAAGDLERLARGVELEDGPTAPAQVKRRRDREIEIVLREGRNRQVRRMFEAVGNEVVALRRVGFGPLRLGGLAEGSARRLSDREVGALRRSAELDAP